MPVNAREAAYLALEAYRRHGARPDMVLANIGGMDGRDRALAGNIVNGVLQNAALLDYRLEELSGRRMAELTPEVLDILRLSAYQIVFLDRVPDRAAVSEGVELSKRKCPRAAGLVNAVLRRLSEKKDCLTDIKADSFDIYLSIKYSHPLWLVRELVCQYGETACEEILRANNTPSPVTAQVNTLRTDAKGLAESLAEQGVETESCPMLSDALRLMRTGPIEELEAYKNGLFYVQDPAARFAVMALGLTPGMSVLDLCAAPGGKSFAAAIAMRDEGRIMAFDIHEKKAALIEKGAARLGLGSVSARAGDGREYHPEYGLFDAVIADVPCSGFGVIRKKPEIRYKTPEEIERLPGIQLEILTNAARYVRPGGKLLYSTCTVLRAENQLVIERFLAENAGMELQSFTLPEPFGTFPGMADILPHVGDTDGFFICLMKKKI